MIEKLRILIAECWKGVIMIAVVLATVGAITAFYQNLVTTEELEAAETRIEKRFELRDNIYRKAP
uniref:Uncharacterized protein n=1 Tax=viral metagenome TaxID=1070528 RepID=A0A6M3M3U7_9ZZZZ